MNRKILGALALGLILSTASLFAQESGDSDMFSDEALFGASESSDELFSDDSLFGGSVENSDEGTEAALFSGGLVEEIPADAVSTAVTDLLESDDVIIGGSFSVSTDVDLYEEPGEVTAELSSRLFLDARPSSDFGVYIKGDLNYDPVDGAEASLREMFADTNVEDTVFLRVGKQAVNWGVGYFYSPANVINLETVDPENPDEELLGPVAAKAHLPLGTTNLYGYVILEDFEGETEPRYAAMGQFLAGNVEVSLGGVYQWDAPWAGILSATTAVGDVNLFGEAVMEGNIDKTFVVEDSTSVTGVSAEAADGLYYSATAGFNYGWSNEDDTLSMTLLGQYYYNGQGYADQTVLTENSTGVAALMGAEELSSSDLMSRGLHYGAASLSFSDIYDSNLTPSVFWLGNIADESGRISAGLSYTGLDNLNLSASWSHSYGEEGMEFTPGGVSDSVSFSISFAESAF